MGVFVWEEGCDFGFDFGCFWLFWLIGGSGVLVLRIFINEF